jgi:hypothetical protein
MQKIKLIVSDKLKQERIKKLNESLSQLELIRNEKMLIEKFLVVSGQLLNEGYTIQEIESSDVYNQLNKVDWGGAVSNTLMTSAKEYAIKFIVQNVLGANPTFSRIFAQFMANVNPVDLLKPFKDEQSCIQHFPAIVDGIIIVIFRSVMANELNVDSNSYKNLKDGLNVIAGNMLGEAIKNSNISETVSNSFCKMIH